MNKKLLLCFAAGVALTQTSMAQLDLVVDLRDSGDPEISGLTVFQDKLYLAAKMSSDFYSDLLSYDGTGDPVMVPGSGSGLWMHGAYGVIGNNMYMTMGDGSDWELYKFDGTSFSRVADIEAGNESSLPLDFTVHNGILYFSAETSTHGRELYKYDPSSDAYTRLTDINPMGNNSISELNVFAQETFTIFDEKIFFRATDNSGDEKAFYYDLNTDAVIDLGIHSVSHFLPNKSFVVLDGAVYFVATEPATGQELYKYDGSSVERVTDLSPGADGGVSQIIETYNGRLYFCGLETEDEPFLYAYDPAADATELVEEVALPVCGKVFNGRLYFSGADSTHGMELWSTDGSSTERVMDLYPGEEGTLATYLTEFDGKLYMVTDNGTSGPELYVLNGTAAVTNVSYTGKITLYPNPVTENLYISVEADKTEMLQLHIYDVSGKEVLTKSLNSGSHQEQISLRRLSGGTYMYNLIDTKGMVCQSGKLSKL